MYNADLFYSSRSALLSGMVSIGQAMAAMATDSQPGRADASTAPPRASKQGAFAKKAAKKARAQEVKRVKSKPMKKINKKKISDSSAVQEATVSSIASAESVAMVPSLVRDVTHLFGEVPHIRDDLVNLRAEVGQWLNRLDARMTLNLKIQQVRTRQTLAGMHTQLGLPIPLGLLPLPEECQEVAEFVPPYVPPPPLASSRQPTPLEMETEAPIHQEAEGSTVLDGFSHVIQQMDGAIHELSIASSSSVATVVADEAAGRR